MSHRSYPHSDEISGKGLDLRLFLRFLEGVRPYIGAAWAALLLLLPVAACKLVQPWLLKIAIDDGILAADTTLLLKVALLFFAVLVAELLLIYVQGYLVQAVGQKIMADLRQRSFAHLLRLPLAFFDRHPSGRLVTRLTSDVENVGELFGAGVVAALGDLVTLAGIVAILFTLHDGLALVTLGVIPFLILVLLRFRRRMRPATRQVRSRLATLNAYLAERLAGMGELRLFGQERRSAAEFDALQREYRASTLEVISADAALYAMVETLGSLAVAAILWYGGGELLAGSVTFGTLVAFIEYVQKFFAPLRDLSAKYAVLLASNASLERIFALLDEAVEEDGGEEVPSQGEGLCGRDLGFAYRQGDPVLAGVDLRLRPGETLALVGATGSGKSTLCRLILGFYPLQQGRLELNGVDFGRLSRASLRQQVGWVAQEPLLFSGSIRANLDPGGELSEARLQELLAASGLARTVERLGGLEAPLTERGGNLSAGERQLLCLVRALLRQPQLLILDEATSRLDATSEAQIGALLRREQQGRALLLVAHRLRTAQRAETILVMHRGKVVERGRHEELLALNGRYARLWALQQMGEEEGGLAGGSSGILGDAPSS